MELGAMVGSGDDGEPREAAGVGGMGEEPREVAGARGAKTQVHPGQRFP